MTALFFNFARNDISALQLPPEKSGGGFCYALVALGQGCVVFSQQEHDAAHQISLGENGAGRPQPVLFLSVRGEHRGVPGMEEVVSPLLHQPGQLGGVGLIHQLPLGGPVEGDNAVPVGDCGDVPGG